jgi:cbb3-type cytochrome oxidase maturation protein
VEILLLLVPLSVVLALLIGAAFAWSVRSGQFDDLEGPAWRVVGDDDGPAVLDPDQHAAGAESASLRGAAKPPSTPRAS